MEVVGLPQRGGCLCGAVRYSLGASPLLAYACHCHDCQTRSGSAFALILVLRSADLTITGPIEMAPVSTPSGRRIELILCPTCRIRILARDPHAADYASLRVGTLDDARWVVPIAQTWVESALPWAVIPGVRAIGPEEVFDFVALGQDWMASAPRFSAL
jgi:hypothetical protein